MIIGIDHGYGNIKSARRVFSTNVIKSDNAPIFSKDYIEYNESFISSERATRALWQRNRQMRIIIS